MRLVAGLAIFVCLLSSAGAAQNEGVLFTSEQGYTRDDLPEFLAEHGDVLVLRGVKWTDEESALLRSTGADTVAWSIYTLPEDAGQFWLKYQIILERYHEGEIVETLWEHIHNYFGGRQEPPLRLSRSELLFSVNWLGQSLNRSIEDQILFSFYLPEGFFLKQFANTLGSFRHQVLASGVPTLLEVGNSYPLYVIGFGSELKHSGLILPVIKNSLQGFIDAYEGVYVLRLVPLEILWGA